MRRWTMHDLPGLHRVLGDPEVVWWDPSVGSLDRSREVLSTIVERHRQLAGELGWFAIIEVSSGEVVGNVQAKPSTHRPWACELGWHVRRDHWRQGIAREAAVALKHHVELAGTYQEFVALIDVANDPSVGVATHLGMRALRTLTYDGEPHVLYSTATGSWWPAAGPGPGQP